jgi:hypothetical protein
MSEALIDQAFLDEIVRFSGVAEKATYGEAIKSRSALTYELTNCSFKYAWITGGVHDVNDKKIIYFHDKPVWELDYTGYLRLDDSRLTNARIDRMRDILFFLWETHRLPKDSPSWFKSETFFAKDNSMAFMSYRKDTDGTARHIIGKESVTLYKHLASCKKPKPLNECGCPPQLVIYREYRGGIIVPEKKPVTSS